MKKFNGIAGKLCGWVLVLAGTAGLLPMTGCMSSHHAKNDSAARSLQIAAGEVQDESRVLDWTMSSLNDLVSHPQADLNEQFRRFDTGLTQLIHAAQRNDKSITQIGERNAKYF